MSGLGLLDVLPPQENVVINGKNVAVYAISARGIGELLRRFPELFQLFDGSVPMETREDVVKAIAPKVVVPIVAAACGNAGDPEAERIADQLSVETQFEILNITRKLTFKDGFGPFVAGVASFMASIAPEDTGKAPFTNLPKRPRPSARQPAPASGT